MYNYIENTQKVHHDLTPEEIDKLRPYLDNIDFDHFDMAGRGTTSPTDFISGCFEQAIQANLTTRIKLFKVFRYLYSILEKIDEDKVKFEFKLMYATFEISSRIFIESIKKK